MDDMFYEISLLPYLERGSPGFRITPVSVLREGAGRGEDGFPFVVVGDSSPLTRIVEARIESDDGSVVKHVFLLMERDDRGRARNEMQPWTNQEIDRWGERAFRPSGVAQPDSVITLANQIGEDGAPRRFQSLFFCPATLAFFHPPCPHCGRSLTLCRDDEMLARSGLERYSVSAPRYLFCPACASASRGATDFYHFSGDPGRSNVKDRWGLINGLGELARSGKKAPGFPCAACQERDACLGPAGSSGPAVIPFAFYPFHMLIFEAPTIHAHDFLFLASGASLEDLAAYHDAARPIGRMARLSALKRSLPRASPFLCGGEKQFFLEVLYLKLSFLEELSRMILHDPNVHEFTDVECSLEPIWVALADQGERLPYYWNFQTRFIQAAPASRALGFLPKSSPFHGLYFLGLVWFYALLVNKSQRIAHVHTALTHALRSVASTKSEEIGDIFGGEFKGVFSPHNIFWDPPGGDGPVDPTHETLWEMALGQGLTLLNAGMDREIPWNSKDFLNDLEGIGGDLKHALFSSAPPSRAPSGAVGDNKAIHDILVRIGNKWRSESDASPMLAALDGGVYELDQTLILPGRKQNGIATPVSSAGEENDEILETIILASDKTGDNIGSRSRPDAPGPDESEKTVVLRPNPGGRPRGAFANREDEEALLKTVAISRKSAGGDAPPASPPIGPPEEDDAPATIILHPERKMTAPRTRGSMLKAPESPTNPADKAGMEDTLAETVILRPKRIKRKIDL